jgi:GDP-L-fucose synthase
LEPRTRIFVAGERDFLGAALARRLRASGCERLVGEGEAAPDLRDAAAVDAFFARQRPDWVFLLGGRSGGIARNQREGGELMLDNLLVETSVLRAAQRHGTRKLLYLAAACIYPRDCRGPMRPEQLGRGPLEPTSAPYALAKWAGLELCRALARQTGAHFVSAIPANPFGPGDSTESEDAHVVGALLERMHQAKRRGDAEVVVWGSGRARRDFLFVDDLADACLFLMERFEGPDPINVSAGSELSIGELAERIQKVVGFAGRLRFDASRPEGAPRKLLDGEPLRRLGWKPRTSLDDALGATYRWLLEREAGMARG